MHRVFLVYWPSFARSALMSHRDLVLTADQRQQLRHLRDHAPKAYVRERAAALLKIADGMADP